MGSSHKDFDKVSSLVPMRNNKFSDEDKQKYGVKKKRKSTRTNKDYARKYYNRHKDKAKKYYRDNFDKIQEYHSKYYSENQEQYRKYNQSVYVQGNNRNKGKPYTQEEIALILSKNYSDIELSNMLGRAVYQIRYTRMIYKDSQKRKNSYEKNEGF